MPYREKQPDNPAVFSVPGFNKRRGREPYYFSTLPYFVLRNSLAARTREWFRGLWRNGFFPLVTSLCFAGCPFSARAGGASQRRTAGLRRKFYNLGEQ